MNYSITPPQDKAQLAQSLRELHRQAKRQFLAAPGEQLLAHLLIFLATGFKLGELEAPQIGKERGGSQPT